MVNCGALKLVGCMNKVLTDNNVVISRVCNDNVRWTTERLLLQWTLYKSFR